MVELLAGPEALRAFAPDWQPLFWDLAERTPEELLQAAGEWLAALAVVRAERTDEAAFREVFAAVLRRLEGLSEAERVRWHDLLWFMLSWDLRRRPVREREELLETARTSQTEVEHREKVREMSETIEQTWEQELITREQQMLERGTVRGQIQEARNTLQRLLEKRFGPLPETVVQRMQADEDLERLRNAVDRVFQMTSLAELEL